MAGRSESESTSEENPEFAHQASPKRSFSVLECLLGAGTRRSLEVPTLARLGDLKKGETIR